MGIFFCCSLYGIWIFWKWNSTVMQMRDLDFELLWWNRGLRRRDHTNQVHKYNLRICLRTKLDVQIYLQCSSVGCFTGSEALQFREKLLSAVRGLYFPAHSLNNREIWLWHSRPSLWVEEKKSTYKTGLTLLHSHRETQVAEERIKVNGVPACADTKVAGNLNTGYSSLVQSWKQTGNVKNYVYLIVLALQVTTVSNPTSC